MKMARYFVAALIMGLIAWGVYFVYLNQPALCDLCGRPVHQETLYRIHLRDGEVKQACCPRCGFHFRQDPEDIVFVEVADFKTKKLLDATEAIYVEGSSLSLCHLEEPLLRHLEGTEFTLARVRCLPSLQAFHSREDAEEFRREQGGVLKSYEQLLEEMNQP